MSAVDDLQDPRHFAAPEPDAAKRALRLATLPTARKPPAQFLIDLIAAAPEDAPLTWEQAVAAWRELHPRKTEQALLGASDDLEQRKLAAAVTEAGAEGSHFELGILTRPSPEPTYVRLALIEAWKTGLLSRDEPVTKSPAADALGITGGSLLAGLESCKKRGLVDLVKAQKGAWALTDSGRRAAGFY